MTDTDYFRQALEEYALKKSAHLKVADLTIGELSWLLQRAQELKLEAQNVIRVEPRL